MKQLRDYVTLNGKQYFVSTKNTFDAGLETMVFESVGKKVINWNDLYFRHYSNEDDARDGHIDIINNLEKCLEEGKTQDWGKDTGLKLFYRLDEALMIMKKQKEEARDE